MRANASLGLAHPSLRSTAGVNDPQPHISRDATTGSLQGPGVRLMRVTTYAAVLVAAFLAAVKLYAAIETGSVAILSSLVDSLFDTLASLVNLIAVRAAIAPHDREHRFGHGKSEPLAGLMQAVVITASVIFVLVEAVPRFLEPVAIVRGEIGLAVMTISIVLTGGLVALQRYAVRRTRSIAIRADSLHYRSDLLMNLGVAAALLLAAYGGMTFFDPLFAVMVAGYVLYSVGGIVRRSYDMLMDREFPDTERARIRDIAQCHPEVIAVHDIRTRRAGIHSFVQLHIELPAEMSLKRAHIVSDEVEAEIRSAFPETDVIIHQDPEGVDEARAEFGSPHFSPPSRPASRPGVRSARSGPKSVAGTTVEARDAAGGRLGATRRAAVSGRQGASRPLPDAPHRAARLSCPGGRTPPRRP